jgi:hypothetical protein
MTRRRTVATERNENVAAAAAALGLYVVQTDARHWIVCYNGQAIGRLAAAGRAQPDQYRPYCGICGSNRQTYPLDEALRLLGGCKRSPTIAGDTAAAPVGAAAAVGAMPPGLSAVSLRDVHKPLHRHAKPFWGLACLERMVAEYPLDIDPDYQRGYVWTGAQQRALVGHVLEGGDTPALVVNEGPIGRVVPAELVDGKQRLTACLRCARG